jgi:hypothetical protein
MMPCASALATIDYLQNFSATSGMANLSTVNWQAYYGSSSTVATLAVPGSGGSPANAMLSGGASATTPGANVNAKATVTATTTGFVPLLSNNGADQFVAYTTEYTIDGSLVSDFSWYSGSMYSGDTQQIVVQIGGNWYASTTRINPVTVSSGGLFGATATQSTLTFNTAAANWQTLNFSPGSDLTLGSVLTSPLPSGTITGFGLYVDIANHSAGNERSYFDTFEIDSVPEPTSLGLLATIGTIGLTSRRERKAR